MSNFIVWYKTDFVNLTKEEIESFKSQSIKITIHVHGYF